MKDTRQLKKKLRELREKVRLLEEEIAEAEYSDQDYIIRTQITGVYTRKFRPLEISLRVWYNGSEPLINEEEKLIGKYEAMLSVIAETYSGELADKISDQTTGKEYNEKRSKDLMEAKEKQDEWYAWIEFKPPYKEKGQRIWYKFENGRWREE